MTPTFGGWYSIQLSYGHLVGNKYRTPLLGKARKKEGWRELVPTRKEHVAGPSARANIGEPALVNKSPKGPAVPQPWVTTRLASSGV